MQIEGPLLRLRARVGGFCKEFNFSLQKRPLLIDLDYLEAPETPGDDIHPSIIVPLDDSHHLGRTTNLGNAVLDRSDDAKCDVVLQALADHLFITRLEDMQRQSHAGKEHEIEREEGEKIAHPVDSKSLTGLLSGE